MLTAHFKPSVKTRWASDRGPAAAVGVASWRGQRCSHKPTIENAGKYSIIDLC